MDYASSPQFQCIHIIWFHERMSPQISQNQENTLKGQGSSYSWPATHLYNPRSIFSISWAILPFFLICLQKTKPECPIFCFLQLITKLSSPSCNIAIAVTHKVDSLLPRKSGKVTRITMYTLDLNMLHRRMPHSSTLPALTYMGDGSRKLLSFF